MKYRNENNSIDEVYCYPNGVLKNKLEIMDEDTLSRLEAELTSINLTSFLINPVKGKLSFKHYRKNKNSFYVQRDNSLLYVDVYR